jgi:hypothetical protein
MGDQLFVIVVTIMVMVAAVVGASYVFAITAERDPDAKAETRRRTSVH